MGTGFAVPRSSSALLLALRRVLDCSAMELERGAVARHRLDVLGLQLLVDAGVSVLSHAPAVQLERGFLMSAVTPAGPFYFKFLPNAVVAELRSEAAVVATLEDEVD